MEDAIGSIPTRKTLRSTKSTVERSSDVSSQAMQSSFPSEVACVRVLLLHVCLYGFKGELELKWLGSSRDEVERRRRRH